MTYHPVITPLESSILPFTTNADKLTSPVEYRVLGAYRLLQGIMGALVSAGLSIPLTKAIVQSDSGIKVSDLSTMTSWFSIALLMGWIILSQYLRHRETEKKYIAATACRNTLEDVESELPTVLNKPDPGPDIGRLHIQVFECVRRARAHGGYPYGSNPPPDPTGRAAKKAQELTSTYRPVWQATLGSAPERREE